MARPETRHARPAETSKPLDVDTPKIRGLPRVRVSVDGSAGILKQVPTSCRASGSVTEQQSGRLWGQALQEANCCATTTGELGTLRRWFPTHTRRPALSLPEYVAPVIAAGGPVALVLVALRFGPDAVLRLLAGAVAVLTGDDKRGERCLEVLRILRKKDDPPTSLP